MHVACVLYCTMMIVRDRGYCSPQDSDDDSDDATDGEDELDTVDKAGGRDLALGRWLRALAEVVPDDDDDFFETEQDAVNSDAPVSGFEDCFEKRSANLPALPDDNDVKWPQENQHYFAGKKKIVAYVRTDKYSLSKLYKLLELLPEDVKLPSILSVYGKKH